MLKFQATILHFEQNGEKTGWRYIEISPEQAEKLNPGVKTSFRVKGLLDKVEIRQVSLMPMGGGDFIMALKGELRKKLKKDTGASLKVQLELDTEQPGPPADLIECLEYEPEAIKFFRSLTAGHQKYFGNWVESAKTEPTRAKRIARIVEAMLKHWDYGTMIRDGKPSQREL